MNAALVLIISIIVLVAGYIFYGGWLAKEWGIDPSRTSCWAITFLRSRAQARSTAPFRPLSSAGSLSCSGS